MLGDFHEEGAILLISCYELGHQPIGLAWPAAFFERAGFRPFCLDIAIDGLDPDRMARARWVGISVPMHTALHLGYRVARHLRDLNPNCHICFFGLYAVLNRTYLLETIADSVVGGEYEAELVRIVETLSETSDKAQGGPGRHGLFSSLEKLDFPVPSRNALPPLERYVRFKRGDSISLVAHVEASRGCRHVCRHCPITPVYAGRFFIVPTEVVLEDLRRQIAAGARHVTFGDPDFLNGPGHSMKIIRAIHEEFPSITFDFTAKIEHLLRHRRLLDEFARLGCVFVVSAVESLSETVLRHLEKGHSRADFIDALSAVRGAGIILRPSFVSFTPWTTLEDYIEVLDMVESEGLVDYVDPIQFTVRLLIPPGSALFNYPGSISAIGKFRPGSFSHVWEHPDPRMDRLYQEVSAVVEKALADQLDCWEIFFRIRRVASIINGETCEGTMPAPPRSRHFLGLTEPWFC